MSLQHLVFVYGTLKMGEPNHSYLMDETKGRAHFVGKGVTDNRYPLVIATEYNIPFLLGDPTRGHQIHGEIYRVDDAKLKHLDELEDYPNFYDRRVETITLQDGSCQESKVKAKLYFIREFNPKLLDLECLSEYSSSGDHGKRFLNGKSFRRPRSEVDTVKVKAEAAKLVLGQS